MFNKVIQDIEIKQILDKLERIQNKLIFIETNINK